MSLPSGEVQTAPVSEPEPHSLELNEPMAGSCVGRLVMTKQGRAAAAMPVRKQEPVELWGALRGLMEPVEGVDLTTPVGETWAAARG